MVLTEEQKERIRVNRDRALEIRRTREVERRQLQAVEDERGSMGGFLPGGSGIVTQTEQTNVVPSTTTDRKPTVKTTTTTGRKKLEGEFKKEEEDSDIELEEFEKGASEFVSKKQATKMYCLPEGTLSVCQYVEKSNPKQPKWSAMKLFHRSEIRRRSRERFGGLEGLREERERRVGLLAGSQPNEHRVQS